MSSFSPILKTSFSLLIITIVNFNLLIFIALVLILKFVKLKQYIREIMNTIK